MAVCTFFGHRECYGLDEQVLRDKIAELIDNDVDTFYVGNHGQFDAAVYRCLKRLQKEYPHIRVCVVLAYLPTERSQYDDMTDTMYPEIEGHPKFAIERRNRWMIDRADFCLCYINSTWGGAYTFAKMALQQGKTVINLGKAKLKQ